MKQLRIALVFWFWMNLIFAKTFAPIAEHTLFNGEKLQEFKLENGFRVLLVSRHQAEVLTYQVWFNVGSIHEKLDPRLKKTGLAHLFEHMMFRGTEKYGDDEFDRITAQLGGDKQNATTSFYRTNYFESVPSRQLERIMELEADRMVNLKLNADLFEKEKGAVVGEYRLHQDRPSSVAFDELMKLMFTAAPYQWTVLGTEEEIKGFTLEEAQYFYKTFYAPNNSILIVVGDVTAETLMALVSKYYGGFIPMVVPSITIPEEPPQKKERRWEGTHRQATSETLVVGYRIPSVMSPEMAAFSLLGTHLSVGMEARLRKLLIDTGMAVTAMGAPDSMPDVFEFYVQLVEGKRAQSALAILDREVQNLQRTSISKAAFERALNQELLDVYGDITSNSSLGNLLGEYYTQCGNYLRGFELVEQYKKLTSGDLQRVAKTYLVKASRSVVIVRPEKKVK